jgi:hypothetical protein
MKSPPETEGGGPTKTAAQTDTEFLGTEEVLSLLVSPHKRNVREGVINE